MTIELTKEPTDGERLQKAINTNTWRDGKTSTVDIDAAAAEFAAPYLARITELEGDNSRLRSVFVPPGSSLILIAPKAASQDEMHDTAKRAADVHDGPVIVMAHDWQSMSVDELRKAVGAHIETMIVSGPGSVGINLG